MDNKKLAEILYLAGYTDSVIESCLRGDRIHIVPPYSAEAAEEFADIEYDTVCTDDGEFIVAVER